MAHKRLIRLVVISWAGAFCLVTGQLDFSGYYQNWTSVRAQEDYDFMLLRNRLRFDASFDQESVTGHISLDIRNDKTGLGPEFEISLREAYVNLYLDRVDFRIGKQQVVWGKADGLFINDIVCPLDMRMFLLQDFDNIRMGLPMIKGNLYLGGWSFEGLWIPAFEPWMFAGPGSDWQFQLGATGNDTVWVPYQSPSGSSEIPNILVPLMSRLPDPSLQNSEFGLKVSSLLLGTDVTVLLLDAFNDHPATVLESSHFAPPPMGPSVFSHVRPQYYRTRMYGLNFSRPINPILVRGEMGYYTNYRFTDFGADLLYTTSDYFQGMIGSDFSGPLGMNISVQGIRQQIMNYNETMVDDEVRHMATLLLSGSLWRETASVLALGIFDPSDDAGLAIVSFDYRWVDGLTVSVGTYLLWGGKKSIFGQFDANDNAFLKVKYSF